MLLQVFILNILQIVDYAKRKNESVANIEKWLASTLSYDPDKE